ncbi:MAG: DUF120 domain-containing protein [Candidatus Cloacimonadota bacterium]|nr:DUF120 domain-containing protein [Candidatus Cloacimonadota bacterium]
MVSFFRYIIPLIKEYGLFESIETSTTNLAELFEISQQSVSRVLIELEKRNFIKRTSSTKGIRIEFKQQSIKLLKKTYDLLDNFFGDFSLQGIIKQGIGEGKFYITHPEYKKRIKTFLRINPFPGTLNLEVNINLIRAMKELFKPIIIAGFETEDRSFGSLSCYECLIDKKMEAWIIFAERTTHPENIIELISENKIVGKDGKIKITFI